MQSKTHYITLGGRNTRTSGNEAIQSLYNLTLTLPDDRDKISDPVF